jgi:hypothetical protein
MLSNAGHDVIDEGVQWMPERVRGLEARRARQIEAGDE